MTEDERRKMEVGSQKSAVGSPSLTSHLTHLTSYNCLLPSAFCLYFVVSLPTIPSRAAPFSLECGMQNH